MGNVRIGNCSVPAYVAEHPIPVLFFDFIKQAVGLDITKNHISLVLTNLAGEMLRYERIYHPYASEDGYYREVSEKDR